MIYTLLFIIIFLLGFIAWKLRDKSNSAKKAFNTPLYPNAVEFVASDERNFKNPNEIVKLGFRYMTRKEAMIKLSETRQKYPTMDEEDIQKIAQL